VNAPAADRVSRIARVLWVTLGLNLIVAVAKLAYGTWSGAVAMTADGIHSLLDASSNVFGLVGARLARRPPDEDHPYGHRKYETFAALLIALMLFLGCYEIVSTMIARLSEPRTPRITPPGYLILLVTMIVNVVVARYERREGKRLRSELLIADAAHTKSDVFSSLLVLASFVAAHLRIASVDLFAAAAIVVLIVRAGWGILKRSFSTLADERRIAPQLVERVAMAERGVLEVHNVRSRGPDDDIHLDLHILVDPTTPIAHAHAIGHRVEGRLRTEWPGLTDVIVHVEPALESERARTRVGGGLAEG